MTTAVPYKAEHLLKIELQEGQRYCEPSLNMQVAQALEGPFAYTILREGKPVAVLGVIELWKNRGLAWSFIGADAGPSFSLIHKIAKKAIDMAPYRRVEADTPCGFVQGHRWLRMLGFTLEAERMHAYLPNGGDSALYAKVKHG